MTLQRLHYEYSSYASVTEPSTYYAQIKAPFSGHIWFFFFFEKEEPPNQVPKENLKFQQAKLSVQCAAGQKIKRRNTWKESEHGKGMQRNLVWQAASRQFDGLLPNVQGTIKHAALFNARHSRRFMCWKLLHTGKSLRHPVLVIGHITQVRLKLFWQLVFGWLS